MNDETVLLLQSPVTNVAEQTHQLKRPGVLNPLYSIFSSISCISRYLSMEDLFAFRSTNRTLNEASEKAFLYWLGLKILRCLSTMPDQENVPLSIRPRYLNPSIEKTIHFPSELKRFIAESPNREKMAGQLFLQHVLGLTAESATMQNGFIQLCRDIGDGAPEPESETRLNCNYLRNKGFDFYLALLLWLSLLAGSIVGLVASVPIVAEFGNHYMPIVGLFASIFCISSGCIIGGIYTSREAPTVTDLYGSQLVLNSYSARMFKRITDSANTVAIPVDWMKRLSKTTEAMPHPGL